MIKPLFTLFMTLASVPALSQIGIFKTYNDFLKNKVIIEYPEYVSTYHALGNFKVVFKDKIGQEVKFDVDKNEFWGYRRGDENVLRVDGRNDPNVIIITGKLIVYGNYTTQIENSHISFTANQFIPLVSKGLNGEMVKLSKKTLKEMLATEPDALSVLKKTPKYYQELMDFIVWYNKK